MSATLISDVERQRHNVVVDSYTPTWNELLEQYKKKDVSVDPAYQRAFRWTVVQQTQYIESLLLSIPTPPVFLAEMEDGKFEVIDGLQRFSTVIKFFADEVFELEKGESLPAGLRSSKPDADANNVEVPTVLTEAPILKGLVGLTKNGLPETLVRTIRYSRIQVILIQRKSSELAKYHVFTRLNRAGTVLSNQEIRNCSARLFKSVFADRLMDLGRERQIISAMNLSDADERSMGVQENVLRLLAFCHFSPESQRIDEFLDQAMYLAASGEFKFNAKVEERVKRTFEIISEAFPKGEAFRFLKDGRFKGAFSSNLFDIVACGIYKNVESNKRRSQEELKGLLVRMHEEPATRELTGAGSNTKLKMIGRVEFGAEWFS